MKKLIINYMDILFIQAQNMKVDIMSVTLKKLMEIGINMMMKKSGKMTIIIHIEGKYIAFYIKE